MPIVLVGTDLTDRSRPAIARGAELVQASGGRLIICHAAPKTLPVNPLFPHQTGEKIAATAGIEQRIIEAVTRQVVDATGFSAFDVIVDTGEAPDVICSQAKRLQADLVIVTADRPGVGAVARDLAASPCSVLVLGTSTGDAVAIVTLESEVESVGPLAEAVRLVLLRPVSKFVVIMWTDSDDQKAPLLAELARTSRLVGVPFEPWFADLTETSVLARAANDPEIGLVALTAPEPDSIVGRSAGPLDDGFEGATASFLLLRR
ncbi:MAG TPA: universal stress protein [Polyangiaceae bacterium]|nr:universal stress protein [Polyangiaceae bacterium]